MDYYFSAANDAAALTVKDCPGGPVHGLHGIDTVEAKDVLACPHLEQLVTIATGRSGASLVPELAVLWPPSPAQEGHLSFEPTPSIMRLPDGLRDQLTEVEVTSQVAAKWAKEIWGFDPIHAGRVAENIVRLAKAARSNNKPLYWWSET